MKVKIELVDDHGQRYDGEVDLVRAGPSVKPRAVTPQGRKKNPTLPERILGLREKGFFAAPRVSAEVFEAIKKTYYCEPDRVTMALIRLRTGKELRKATKLYGGKKLNAYVW